MASLQQIVHTRCTGYAALTTLIGTRCYPDRVPERATYPLVVYHAPIASDDSAYRTHATATRHTDSLVQFDCYATTSAGAESVADAVVNAWNGYYTTTNCNVRRARVQNRIHDRQDDLNEYRVIVDVLISHPR